MELPSFEMSPSSPLKLVKSRKNIFYQNDELGLENYQMKNQREANNILSNEQLKINQN